MSSPPSTPAPPPPPAELFSAIEKHDMGRVTDLLARGADPNATETEWRAWRPLHTAIDEQDEGASIDLVKLLMDRGADVNGWDGRHEASALLMAVFRNNKDVMRLLLDAGADPNVRSGEGNSPLRWAVEQGDIEMARMVLDAGAGKTMDEFGEPRGLTALGLAVERMDLPMIQLLLDAGADREARDWDNRTARERLPSRQDSDPKRRAEVLELLAGTSPTA
jgi:ankyrin repeat protein